MRDDVAEVIDRPDRFGQLRDLTRDPTGASGATFLVSSLRRFRILAINNEIDGDGLEELYGQGVNGIFAVEPSG